MLKKIEPISIISVFVTATLVFFLPYIINNIKTKGKHYDYNLVEKTSCQSRMYQK